MRNCDTAVLVFVSSLMETKARMLETAARLAGDTDSNLYRANVLDEIVSSCWHIDRMLAVGNTEDKEG